MSTLLRDRRAVWGGTLLGVMLLAAILAPIVAPLDPAAQPDVAGTRFVPPLSADRHGIYHPLGTDRFGRDVWARLVYGARVSLSVSALAVLVSVVVGVGIGAVAGFGTGIVSTALIGATDFALALPRAVLLLLLASLWPPSAGLVVVVLGLTGWMPIARLVHGEVRAVSARPYVESAMALGARSSTVLWRHVVPNALTPVAVAAALAVGNAITLEAGLSFLGLGVQPPAASWGNMIASGRDTLVNAPWVAAAPGVAIALAVVACTLLGDALNDALRPAGQGAG